MHRQASSPAHANRTGLNLRCSARTFSDRREPVTMETFIHWARRKVRSRKYRMVEGADAQ